MLEVGEDKDLKDKDHSRFQRYDTGQDLSWMEGGKQATREREGMEEVLGLTLMGPTVSFLFLRGLGALCSTRFSLLLSSDHRFPDFITVCCTFITPLHV